MAPSTFKDYLLLHFIVLIWGVTSILGLLISLPSLELVFYRTLLAAIGVAVLMGIRKESLRVAPMDLLKIIGVGVLISLHWIFFFWSAKVSTFGLPCGNGDYLTLDVFFRSLNQQKAD